MGIENLSWGAISSCALLQIEPLKELNEKICVGFSDRIVVGKAC